ncbi:hydrogenase 3 maturation endopeptidase HyCI [Thermococcus chitonophagus]|uniref:Hydrogenase 3 maturation endopeptidase HyCI n=1 Tax=Thermococcus chitonophagus TaxID=54262 RepID=A0A170SIP4_9EURY|nr:hydrogenase maturation peptidase HycI [Thermococcus chitonophagus]ASJ17035.1 hydrogenase 3 maturation endopeptidase HyCI [Thermococcus chitonophagus]CUX77624.1 Hydrogenase 3 maturation protease [Thermococcus chitonophagus]
MDIEKLIKESKRIVICGIGNELRGDDAFGIVFVEKLKEKVSNENILILNCGPVPESFLGKIIEFKPDLIIFVDAVHFNGKPGELIIADPEGTLGDTISTHGMPLKILMKFIKGHINAKAILIGCQPKSLEMFGEVSEEVKKALEKLISLFCEIL